MVVYYYEEPEFDSRVEAYAADHGLDVGELDWHLEACHGWERHDRYYEEAIAEAATCTDEECDMTSYWNRRNRTY